MTDCKKCGKKISDVSAFMGVRFCSVECVIDYEAAHENRPKFWTRVFKIFQREYRKNNWIKVLIDKGVRYFLTLLILGVAGYGWQLVNEPLLVVAFAMPVIDLFLFDLLDKYRKEKK